MNPMLSLLRSFEKATPTTLPDSTSANAGPPLLPGLMAASICTVSSALPPWLYARMSTLLTTPLVTLMESPPTG